MPKSFSSISTNTGRAPFSETASAVAINVFAGTITSSLVFRLRPRIPIISASVPELIPMTYFTFK